MDQAVDPETTTRLNGSNGRMDGVCGEQSSRSPRMSVTPTLSIDMTSVPVTSRFDTFYELVRPLYEVQPQTHRYDLKAAWTLWRLGQLVISDASFSALTFDRRAQMRSDQDPNFLLFEMYTGGYGHGLIDGTSTFIDRGRIHVVDMSRSFRTTTGDATAQAVLIPHAAVGYDPSRHAPYCSLSVRSPTGRILVTAFRALMHRLPHIMGADAEEVAARFIDTVRAFLISRDPEVDPHVIRRARKLAILVYIDQHIADPALDARRLCQTFNVSRATLYRLFNGKNGIDGYISSRRLNRCLRDLQQALPGRGHVRAVRERWGFHNASHFNRLFKNQFGVSPVECLGAEAAAIPEDAVVELDPLDRTTHQMVSDWLTFR